MVSTSRSSSERLSHSENDETDICEFLSKLPFADDNCSVQSDNSFGMRSDPGITTECDRGNNLNEKNVHRSFHVGSSSNHPKQKRAKKSAKVGFSSVRVHSHECVLGSNPSVSSGLPIELEWDYILSETFDIDDYERAADGQPKKPLRVGREEREARLRMKGHSRSSFIRTSDEIMKIKASREDAMKEKKLEDIKESDLDDYMVMANASRRDSRRSQKMNIAAPELPSPRRSLSPKFFSRNKVSSKTNSPPEITLIDEEGEMKSKTCALTAALRKLSPMRWL